MALLQEVIGVGTPGPLVLLMMLMIISVTQADFGIGFKTWPPSEVLAVPGSQVRLSCATNVTADKISWQYNHHFLLAPPTLPANVRQQPPFTVEENGDGSELIINVGKTHEEYRHQLGLYQCVSWFGAIALTSLPGRLEAAVLDEFPQSSSEGVEMGVVEGEAARIECGNPTLSVPDAYLTFYKDGKPIDTSNDTVYHVTPHGDLLLMSVGAWAVGEYSCTAYNPVLNRTVSAPTRTKLILRPPPPQPPLTSPQFVTLSSHYTAQIGASVRLLCIATGHPKPRITWSKYGGTLSPRSQQKEDGFLLIAPVTVEDEGTYLCHATTFLGEENVIDISLEIVEPPHIVRSPASQDVEEGNELSLNCRAAGNPKPKVMWVFNGGLVRNDGNIHITEAGLTIRSVEKKHAGIFQCFAHNPEGSVQSVAIVSVVPKTITADPGTARPNVGHLPNEEKHGHGRHTGQRRGGRGRGYRRGGSGIDRKGHPGTDGKMHGITAVESDEKDKEESESPEEGSWKKGKKGVMVPPSKPNMRKVSDESVMITWDVPDNTGLPVLFYKVQYKEVRSNGNRGSRWMTVDEDIPSHINSYEVTGLETGRVYRFRIAAVYANNDNKLGRNSRRFLLEKDLATQRPVYPPTILMLIPQGPTAVKIEWEYEETPGVPVEGFFINYRESTVAGDYTKVTVLDSKARSHVISHLKANVSYNFKMQCFNLAGASDFSAIHKKNVAGLTQTTTNTPVTSSELIPIVKNDDLTISSIYLYIILGAVLGLLLLIVIVSSIIYACRNRHNNQDIPVPTKYEDTSLHIHREAAAYVLPQCQNNGRTQNGYLSHQGVVVAPLDSEKVAMESSFIENNNHNIQRLESCYSPSAQQPPSLSAEGEHDSSSDRRNQTVLRTSSDTFESTVVPCSETDTVAR